MKKQTLDKLESAIEAVQKDLAGQVSRESVPNDKWYTEQCLSSERMLL